MDLQNFSMSQKPSHIYIFFIIFTSLANYILSLDPKFLACRSFTCGDGQYIRYPFWVPNVQHLSVATQTLRWSAKTKTQFSQLPMIIISLRTSFTQTRHFYWLTPRSMSTHALLLCIILALIKLHLVLVWITLISQSSTIALQSLITLHLDWTVLAIVPVILLPFSIRKGWSFTTTRGRGASL